MNIFHTNLSINSAYVFLLFFILSAHASDKKATTDAPSIGNQSDPPVVASAESIESTIQATKALICIAATIEKGVLPSIGQDKKLVIYDDEMVKELLNYKAFKTQIALFKQQYNNLAESRPVPPKHAGPQVQAVLPIAGAVTAAQGLDTLLGVAKNFYSLFKTDVTITPRKVVVDEESLVAEVARSFKKDSRTVIYPKLVPFGGFESDDPKDVIADLTSLFDIRLHAIGERDAQGPELNDKDYKEELDKYKTKFTEYLKRVAALNDVMDKFILGLDPDSKVNVLGSLVRAKSLCDALQNKTVLLLRLHIVAAGGNDKLTDNFFTGKKLYFAGGAVVSYMLFDGDGGILTSQVLYMDVDFQKAKDLSNNLSDTNCNQCGR